MIRFLEFLITCCQLNPTQRRHLIAIAIRYWTQNNMIEIIMVYRDFRFILDENHPNTKYIFFLRNLFGFPQTLYIMVSDKRWANRIYSETTSHCFNLKFCQKNKTLTYSLTNQIFRNLLMQYSLNTKKYHIPTYIQSRTNI